MTHRPQPGAVTMAVTARYGDAVGKTCGNANEPSARDVAATPNPGSRTVAAAMGLPVDSATTSPTTRPVGCAGAATETGAAAKTAATDASRSSSGAMRPRCAV